MNKMESGFRIKESLYIETIKNKLVPLIPAGRRVPTAWEQTFTTFQEEQRSFDLHLLCGIKANISDTKTLGKWRIAGIPPGSKGAYRIRVNIRIGVDGSVSLGAILLGQSLPVTFLTETLPKIPLTIKVPGFQLEKLVKMNCWDCKSNFVVSTTNWKDEPFALCLDCGKELALPETLTTSVTAPWDEISPDLLNTLGIEQPHTPGGLPDEDLEELKEKGFILDPKEESDLGIDADKVTGQLPGVFLGQKKSFVELDHDEIVKLAGDPLPEDERINCPKCDAVISRHAKRCEWCGRKL
jgi:hypothetical protein